MSYENPALTPLSSRVTVTLADGREVRLGRVRPPARPQVMRFASYWYPQIMTSPPPDTVDYAAKAMESINRYYLNDKYGDCVIASAYHEIGLWTGNESGTPALATDAEVLAAYHGICGPGDNGCVITAVLDYMKSSGLQVGGVRHKISDYVAVDWTNKLETQVTVFLFGTLKLGVNLPSAWTSNDVWDVTNTRIVGGHDVPVVGYNPTGPVIATWGGTRQMTWAAFLSKHWVEEAYAPLAPDWTAKDGVAACGVDAAGLAAALADLRGGNIPPIVINDPWDIGGFA